MNYAAVLDVSSVVWSPTDYEANTDSYFQLKDKIFDFIEKVEAEKPPILMRSNLIDQMINGFPFSLMPTSFYDFGNVMFKFLDDISNSIITFEADDTIGATATPQIVKGHFNETIVEEIQFVLNEMHKNNELTSVYFTFKYLWKENTDLSTKVATGNEKIYKTIIADDGDSVKEYFNSFKKIFIHSPKHHPGNRQGNYVSPLTCYKNEDTTLPQKYLDDSVQIGSKHFAYDDDNKIYVVFFRTGGNIYHGHDEVDVNKIPARLEKNLNNNG